MEKASQTERLLNLVCVLLTSELGMTKAELFESVRGYKQKQSGNPDALIKLFERDKKQIREYGVQMVSDTDENDQSARYKIAQGEFMWPAELKLTGKQLELLELAAMAWSKTSIQTWADFGLVKLRALGHTVEHSLIGIAPRITSADQNFEIIGKAIADNQQVSFSYKKMDATTSDEKLIQPAKLRSIEGEWVLLGKDMETDELKNYLLRRITSKVESHEGGVQVSISEMDAAEEELSKFIEGNQAKLVVRENSEAEFRYGSSGEVISNFMDEELFSEDLLDLASSVQVVSPESLRIRMQEAIRRVAVDHA